jgi:cobalt-zinc-cadmium efflux system protein
MGHHHGHDHGHGHGEDQASNNILVALLLNVAFAIIELFGGLYTNSVAIMSDALHDFGDALSLGVAWYLQKISKRPRDAYYSYGYKRFSLLGSLIVSLVLVVGVAIVVYESVQRLLHPEPTKAQGMLWFVILGILVSGFAALRLKSGKSLNERAVYLHLLEDVLGWVAVLISSVVLLFYNAPYLDPLISLAITCFILYNVIKNLFAITRILMLEVPPGADLDRIRDKLLHVSSVKAVEDLHLWTLDGENHVMTVQIIVGNRETFLSLSKLKKRIRQDIAAEGIFHSTIEFCTGKEDLHQHH